MLIFHFQEQVMLVMESNMRVFKGPLAKKVTEKEYKMYIGGQWVSSPSTFEVRSPYDGSLVGRVPIADPEQVDTAIGAAATAYETFSVSSLFERYALLEKIANLITEHTEDLARIITSENSKVIRESRAEVLRAADTFLFAAEEAKRIHGETIPLDAVPAGKGRFAYTVREPIGVIAAISPFNAPLNLVAHKVAPAIASGNTVVLKPASSTPLIALRLAELLEEAGIQKGVFNVVTGSSSVGEQLVKDPRVVMVSFTGSPEVGRHIRDVAGFKRFTFELGSNSAVLVDDDSRLAEAVDRCVQGGFAHSGQVCISTQRILVNRDIEKEFVGKLIEAVGRLRVGDPFDEKTDVSALITSKDVIRVLDWINEAKSSGAKVAVGGERVGNAITATVLTGVKPDMKIFSEEVFGPLVGVTSYATFDEAIGLVNSSRFGINAGVYTSDLGKAMKAAKEIKAGAVLINDVPSFRVDHMPYGGVKESGLGREGLRYAIEEMTELKLVVFKL